MFISCAYRVHVMPEKTKKNISIDPKLRDMGERLAAQDHRDFSAEVGWLIESECKRRDQFTVIEKVNGNGKKKAA